MSQQELTKGDRVRVTASYGDRSVIGDAADACDLSLRGAVGTIEYVPAGPFRRLYGVRIGHPTYGRIYGMSAAEVEKVEAVAAVA